MSVLGWVVVGLLAFNSVVSISLIGKPRRPISPTDAMVSVLVNFGLVLALVLTS